MQPNKVLWGVVVALAAMVISLIIIVLSQGQPSNEQKVDPTNPIVAKIAHETIDMQTLRQALYSKYGEQLLNQMVDRVVIRLEGESRQLKPDATDIKVELQRMQQGYDNEEHFYQSMKEQLGLSREEIREDAYYKLMLDNIATADIIVTEQEVDAYIANHPDEVKNRVQIRLQLIVHSTAEQAKQTVQLARQGTDFAKLARDRSIDTATAGEGGDLGWMHEDDPFVSSGVRQVAKLLKVGGISDPIQVENGYAVVKLVERKEESRGTPQQLRKAIRQELALQKAPPLQEVIRGLREKYKVELVAPTTSTTFSK